MQVRVHLALVSLLLIAADCPAAPAKPAAFVPPDGAVLLIVGQNLEDIRSYVEAAHIVPGGVMGYTSLAGGEGLETPFNQGDGTQDLQKLIDQYPETAVQIGLWMVNDCARTACGELDAPIDRLARWIYRSRRPVYLRIGYEFDNPQNHYPPEDYAAAYRHLVDRFRQHGVTNAAFVWHSCAGIRSRPLDDWYPGDDYVDWVGLSYFNQAPSSLKPIVEFARRHAKPVMIAESSPWYVQTHDTRSWQKWFVPYFKFIKENRIQAISYIGTDWDASKQFRGQHWGDTRLQINPDILRRWHDETADARYLKASPALFKSLGFVAQPAPSEVNDVGPRREP